MAITASDLGVTDEDLARRIMVSARRVAPCIDKLIDPARADAIAVLKGVIAELPEAGSWRAKSMSRNGTAITFADIESAFTVEARANLRSLCGDLDEGLAQGSFPEEKTIERLWPGERYP